MSESVWRIMLFKLFTQRKEMERKLGELHETEKINKRSCDGDGLGRVGVGDNEVQRRK